MRERFCQRCGMALYAEEKTCPRCGARFRPPGLQWYLLFLTAFVLFYLLLAAD